MNFFSTQEAAKELGVSHRKLKKYLHSVGLFYRGRVNRVFLTLDFFLEQPYYESPYDKYPNKIETFVSASGIWLIQRLFERRNY